MRVSRLNTKLSLGWLLYATSFFGLFFCSFYSGTTFIAYGNINFFENIARVYAFLAIGGKCIYIDKYRQKEIIIYMLMVILSLIVFFRSGRGTIFEVILLIIGAKGIPYKKILKLYLKMASVFLLITIIASLTGIILDYTTIRTLGGVKVGSRLRHSFGINYATDFAAHVFFIFLTYRVLTFNKRMVNVIDLILTVLIVAGLEYYCNARLSEILILVTFFMFWIFERKKYLFQYKLFQKSVVISFPVAAAISIVTAIMYKSSNAMWVLVDGLLFSNRLKISHKVFEKNGIKWFGQYIYMQGLGYKVNGFDSSIGTTYLDSSYVQLLFLYGIVMTIFIIIILINFAKKTIQYENIGMALAAVILAVSCIINQYLLNIAYNPFIIVAGTFVLHSSSIGDMRSERLRHNE